MRIDDISKTIDYEDGGNSPFSRMNNTPDKETPANPADLYEQEASGQVANIVGGVVATLATLIGIFFVGSMLFTNMANELAETARDVGGLLEGAWGAFLGLGNH